MTNQIVTVNVTRTQAPAPSILQRTGALISQGGTTTAVDTRTLLTVPGDLTAILAGSHANASLTWSGSVVTVTTTAPHGFTISDVIPITISGVTPTAYNGTYNCTITGASTFTYALVSNPGSETIPGVYTVEDVAELLAMVTTFFAQGSATSVYVLELGAGSAADGVTALDTYIDNNPGFFYSYLVPRGWATESTFATFADTLTATTAKTYFFVTASAAGASAALTAFAGTKSVILLIEAAAHTATEFSSAADFHVSLTYNPSTTNQVTPFAFAFLFAVTAFPTPGNGALFAAWKAAGANWVGTGAEGGISNKILLWGTTMDGRDFTYWYAVDWFQINLDLDLSNEIINGSNNPLAPLYYDQMGINRLQARAQGTANRGVTYGLLLGPVTVDAVPFNTYVVDNPSDYPLGVYNGLSCSAVPKRGFISIEFNLNITDFPNS